MEITNTDRKCIQKFLVDLPDATAEELMQFIERLARTDMRHVSPNDNWLVYTQVRDTLERRKEAERERAAEFQNMLEV